MSQRAGAHAARSRSLYVAPRISMLHITSGDITVGVLKAAGMPGTYVAWRDILHDGPVPAGLSLPELSRVRVEFIASCGWGRPEEIQRQFQARDAALGASLNEDEVVLW